MTTDSMSLFEADREALTTILDGEPRYRLDQLGRASMSTSQSQRTSRHFPLRFEPV